MSDLDRILFTATLTILGGVCVYVVGQLLSKFFIGPAQELRRTIGEVRFNLSFHPPTIHTFIGRSSESSEETRAALMKNSSDLLAKLHQISLYQLLAKLSCGFLPLRTSIEEGAVQLRGLSTYMHQEGINADNSADAVMKRVERIEKLLHLKPLP